ncbi:MAG: MarR family winged helix-turn-helix transcriptional regulator [Burkholderiaceae bacterium]
MSKPSDKAIAKAVEKLRLAIRYQNRRAQAETGEGSPTRSEQAVLAWLDERGPSTATELAGLERVRPQSMAQTLDQLEAQALLKRERDMTDRRRWTVSLTDVGRRALGRGRAMRQAGLTKAMHAALNDAERARLVDAIDLLDRVIRYQETDND